MTHLVKTICAAVLCLVFSTAHASLTLVANPYPTLISGQSDEPARINAVINEAFKRAGISVTLVVERPAFSGSGLLSGKYQGEFARLTLAEPNDQFLYSRPFSPAHLYLASKSTPLTGVKHFEHVMGSRVAAENRLVNTPLLREEKAVNWARNPSTYDVFKQVADKRADLLLADKLIIDEFNLLLTDADEEPLVVSPSPLVKADFVISINKQVKDAPAIISAFNQAIESMREDNTLATLLQTPAASRKSLLDANVYKRLVREW